MNTYTELAEKHLKSPISYKESPEGGYMLCQHLNKNGKTPMGARGQNPVEGQGSKSGTLRTHFMVVKLDDTSIAWEGKMAASISWESEHRLKVKETTATASAPTSYLYDLRTKKRVALDAPQE